MIQAINRGNTDYLDAPIDELKQFLKETVREAVRDELIKNLPKKEPKVLPLSPVWLSTKEAMAKLDIKSREGLNSYFAKAFREGRMKKDARGGRNGNRYLIIEK